MAQEKTQELNSTKIKNLPIIDHTQTKKTLSEKEEKYLREEGTYEFRNIEEPGLMQKFTYGNSNCKHTFTFMDGGKYQLPRFIARHVESKSTPIWGWKPDGTGSLQKTLKTHKSRFQMREVF